MENACALARCFTTHHFDVVIADVLSPGTILLYRALLPGCLIVRLHVTPTERRSGGRRRARCT